MAGTATWAGSEFYVAVDYMLPAVLVIVGVGLGRVAGWMSRRWLVPEAVAGVAVASLLVPMYPNAQGALGVQLVGLAMLVLVTTLPRAATGGQANWTLTVVTASAVMGALLAARSDAAAILVVPLAAGAVLASGASVLPSRRIITTVAGVVLVWGSVMVIWLASLTAWPAWLRANTMLSQVRHTLWADALALWRGHLVYGAGAGAFTEGSELASSDASLARVHSSVLQVASELGLVGLFLFALIVVAGLVLASRGDGASGVIAVGAWTCLGLHSLIDHLWEFPAVVISAGAVLGWARSARGSGNPHKLSLPGG